MTTAHQAFTAASSRTDNPELAQAYAAIAGGLPLSEQDLAIAAETIRGAYIGILAGIAFGGVRDDRRQSFKDRARFVGAMAHADAFVVLGYDRAEALDRAHTVWAELAEVTGDGALALERDMLESAFDLETT